MNITDILAHDDSDNGISIPSVDKSLVSSIKETTDAGQVVYVMDSKKNKLKLLIKCKNLQLTNDQIGTYITVRSANKDGKLVGVKFSSVSEKKKVIISSSASIIYSESPESKADKKTMPKPQEESKVQLTEKQYPTDKEAAKLYESSQEYNLPEEFEKGPQDHHILELFQERLYIFHLVKRNAPEGIAIDFNSPWITGIHIECSKSSKGILAPPPKKKKYNKLEKPYNPTNHDGGDAMIAYLSAQSGKPWYKTTLKNGDCIGDAMQDQARRMKLMAIFYANRLKQLKGNMLEVVKSLQDMFDEAPSSIQTALSTEAVAYDQCEISGLDYSDNYDEVLDLVTAAMSKFRGDLAPTNLKGIATVYFKASPEDRDVR